MFDSYANLIKVLGELGKVGGRKKLQKIVFISQKAGMPMDEDFDYYLYGPYSESLSNKLGELSALGLLVEEKRHLSSGYQQYSYTLSSKGCELVKTLPELSVREKQLLQILNSYDGRFLELLATLWFLLDKGYSKKQAEEEILTWLKPEQGYTHEEFLKAMQLLNELKGIMDDEVRDGSGGTFQGQ